jgi:hypothetical protein
MKSNETERAQVLELTGKQGGVLALLAGVFVIGFCRNGAK